MNLPHPLEKFSSNGRLEDAVPAQIILDFIQDATLAEPDSSRAIGALWFLLESERVFFFACAKAGIDGDKLREHLRKSVERAKGNRCATPRQEIFSDRSFEGG